MDDGDIAVGDALGEEGDQVLDLVQQVRRQS